NTLQACPHLARHPHVHRLVVEVLSDRDALGYRRTAADVLHRIGDPLGIIHLTYNALTTHPTLSVRQDDISGWSQVPLLRQVAALTPECIELLIRDLPKPAGCLHVDVLAALPAEVIVPRMLPLLAAPGTQMAAAYVLALHRRHEGRAILERLVESETHLELALTGLSHIPDGNAREYLRRYADPDHPFYKRNVNGASVKVRRQAELRLFLVQNAGADVRVRDAIRRFYLHSLEELTAYAREAVLRDLAELRYHGSPLREEWERVTSHWLNPPADFHANYVVLDAHLTFGRLGTGLSGADFLWEFSDSADRVYYAEAQRASIRALLAVTKPTGNGRGWGIEPSFLSDLPPSGEEYGLSNYYLPGVKILYEPEDYERAAVQWILEPEKHRFGSCTRRNIQCTDGRQE